MYRKFLFCPHVHSMHIINPHRHHANHALTLKCIVHIWTSGLRISSSSMHKARRNPAWKNICEHGKLKVQQEQMEKLFRAAYYLVLAERPFRDFAKLVFQECNGLLFGHMYRNVVQCRTHSFCGWQSMTNHSASSSEWILSVFACIAALMRQ